MLKQVIFVIQHVFSLLKQICGRNMSNLMASNSKFSRKTADSNTSSGKMFRKLLEDLFLLSFLL